MVMKNIQTKASSKPKVAVVGPSGTFSEKVAKDKWKEEADIHFANRFSEIFDLVEKERVDFGIVPTEDSVEGDVQVSLDLLRRHDVYIVDELRLKLTHSLLGKKRIADLKVIGSHPQALLHCQRYLDVNFPTLDRRETSSTAAAARLASEDSSFGAIADERVAEMYGLNVLKREIHDYGENTTRFLVISKKPTMPSGVAKTSIIVYPREDRPGVLEKILRPFSTMGVNLSRIVSRPSGRKLGEYIFFIDFEVDHADPKVKQVLEDIEKLDDVLSVRNLGSYPYSPIEKEIKKKEIDISKIDQRKFVDSTFEFWDNKEDKIYDTLS